MITKISLFLAFLPTVFTLYADQAGKWDWRKQYVGGITNAAYGRNGKLIFVSSEQNVIAAIDSTSGEIVWRHLLSPLTDAAEYHRPNLLYLEKENLLLSVDSYATTISAWNAENGVLKWTNTLHDGAISRYFHGIPTIRRNPLENNVVVHSGQGGLHVVNLKNGELLKTVDAPKPYQSMEGLDGTKLSFVEFGHAVIYSAHFNFGTMTLTQNPNIQVDGIDRNSCVHMADHAFCIAGTESKIISLQTGAITPTGVASAIHIRSASNGYAAIYDRQNTVHLFDSNAKKIAHFEDTQRVSVQIIGDVIYVTTIDTNCHITTFMLNDQTKELKQIWKATEDIQTCSITEIYPNNDKRNNRVLIVQSNNELSFIEGVKVIWRRDEALARVSAIEMLDLPLTESQANIEIEFSDEEGNEDWQKKHVDGFAAIIPHFVKRVRSQIQQLRRSMLTAVQHMLNFAETGSIKHGIATDSAEFERDYFGLHKLILLVSDDGMVFGLDNRDGSVRWRKLLGSKLRPNSANIFVARTTAYHPHPARVYLTFDDRQTEHTTLVVMDPIFGTVIENRQLHKKAALITMVPCQTEDSANALLIVFDEDKTLLYPEKEEIQCSAQSVHVMLPDESDAEYKAFKGYMAIFKKSPNNQVVLTPSWRTVITLPKSASLAIVPKRVEERVHSLGRVLGDRSVLYKYVNPHLIALLAHTDSTVALALLDAVTGTVVHQERHNAARLPATLRDSAPLVHCENWIVYSIWSEKARRCEMIVLDLYEGGYQTDAERFSAFAPTLSPPMVLRQSYIFVQSPTAMGVTNTDRGLTNRVVLFALPLGGLVEMPKAFLDARRPIVPTPEHREEGIRPYMPELPLMTENVVNYNRSVENIRHIRTFPSGLESTSLALATGLDMFYTRLTPSGTFDILKDDFDHYFISLVLIALVLASLISKRFAKNKDLKQAWK